MNDNDIRTLLSRLDKLEGNIGRLKAHNRLLSWALLGLLAMSAFLFILSAAAQPDVQDVVRAKSFEVVGTDGKIMAMLSASAKGSELVLHDASGNPRAELNTDLDNLAGTGLVLYNDDGIISARLSTLSDSTPWLLFNDGWGRRRAEICTLSDMSPSFMLYDVKGKKRSELAIRADDTAGLALYDANGASRVNLGMLTDSSPLLGLYDARENLRVALGSLNDDTSGLAIYVGEQSSGGRKRAELCTTSDGAAKLGFYDANVESRMELHSLSSGTSEIGLWDADGKLLFSAP